MPYCVIAPVVSREVNETGKRRYAIGLNAPEREIDIGVSSPLGSLVALVLSGLNEESFIRLSVQGVAQEESQQSGVSLT